MLSEILRGQPFLVGARWVFPLCPKEDGSTSWAPLEGPLWGQATGLLPRRVCQGLRPANTVALALAGYVLADG